jgi:AhpD family alkylhydroperoxidase
VDGQELLGKIRSLLQDPEATVEALLDRIKESHGAVGLVPRMLSRRPEVFIPASIKSQTIYQTPRAIDPKTAELAAVAAASALMCEHCLDVHMQAALRKGASQDEIMDVILIAGSIAESSTLSVALRKFRKIEGKSD